MYIVSYQNEEDWEPDYEPLGKLRTFAGETEAFEFTSALIRQFLPKEEKSEEEQVKEIHELLNKKQYSAAARNLNDLLSEGNSKEERDDILDLLNDQDECWASESNHGNTNAVEQAIRDFNNLSLPLCNTIVVTFVYGPGENE